jgi:hypothetical protein
MAKATNPSTTSPSRFHNVSNEALADMLGHADAVLKGAEAEVNALKEEFRQRYFADRDEGLFPAGVCNDDGSEETFDTELIRHAADALSRIARPSLV